MTLGQEIRYYRKKKGLTQTAFGALFGMSKQAVYSWETGLYSPDISVLLKMADFFQIPICILVIRAIHALPPEKQEAIKTLLNINDKK